MRLLFKNYIKNVNELLFIFEKKQSHFTMRISSLDMASSLYMRLTIQLIFYHLIIPHKTFFI